MRRARIGMAALGILALTGAGAAAMTPAATAETGRARATQAETAAGPAAALAEAAYRGIDPRIAVPAGNKLALVLKVGRGVQTYQCTNNAWTFLEPAATLVNRYRTPVVLHSRGPVWISAVDGSAVNAAAVPGASVPRDGAVPELLLKATANRGGGIFGKVSYIQRIRTGGGLAPTGSCTNGAQTGVPYTATYTFYVPASR
jgi:Protein of unknown function (DUF3455)